jgi:hypothetical protein
MRLGGVHDVKPKALMERTDVRAQAIAGGAAALGLVSQVSEPVKAAADQLAAFTDAPIIANIVTILLTVAGLAALAGIASASIKRSRGL